MSSLTYWYLQKNPKKMRKMKIAEFFQSSNKSAKEMTVIVAEISKQGLAKNGNNYIKTFVADDTAKAAFTFWGPTYPVQIGSVFKIENVMKDEYNGKLQLKVGKPEWGGKITPLGQGNCPANVRDINDIIGGGSDPTRDFFGLSQPAQQPVPQPASNPFLNAQAPLQQTEINPFKPDPIPVQQPTPQPNVFVMKPAPVEVPVQQPSQSYVQQPQTSPGVDLSEISKYLGSLNEILISMKRSLDEKLDSIVSALITLPELFEHAGVETQSTYDAVFERLVSSGINPADIHKNIADIINNSDGLLTSQGALLIFADSADIDVSDLV